MELTEEQRITPTIEDNSQQWKGMDGSTVWHLIERHADNWADVGKMMDEWLAANKEAPVAQPASAPSEPVEDDAPFYDVEDEAHSLCDELLTCGMNRWALQYALSKAYSAGKGSPQPDYKAQRDELIEALGIAQAAINCAGISTPKIVCDTVEKYPAIASVKGGER